MEEGGLGMGEIEMELPPNVSVTSASAIQEFIKNSPLQKIVNWGRKNSLWFMTHPMGCCGIEQICVGVAHYDTDRFGIIPRCSPRQADVMMISGYVSKKYLPALQRVWDQMLEPKWILMMGECAISGGPWWESYSTVTHLDEIFPVDIYIPGCPPRPEALLQGFIELQKKIVAEQDRTVIPNPADGGV